jgi:RNA polymerase primary sigma factor
VDSTATAAVKDTDMARSEQPRNHTTQAPVNIIDTVNKVVRTSRQMLTELGREPTPEELAATLAMPLEKLRKVLEFAKRPIRLETWTGGEPDPLLG